MITATVENALEDADHTVATDAEGEESTGTASSGPWLLAWASRAGIHHRRVGKPCEDTVAYRFHPATFGCTARENVALAVADGVSGGVLGQLASFTAASYCVSLDGVPTVPQPSMKELDRVVYDALAKRTLYAGASTLAAAWLSPRGCGWLAHVGDVRAYRYTPAELEPLDSLQPLTRDHSYLELGELPPAGVPAHNPARMVGTGDAVAPELQPLLLQVGDFLLLASDGLHRVLSERCLALWLHGHLECGPSVSNIRVCAHGLVRQAINAGSTDDVSVLLLQRRLDQ